MHNIILLTITNTSYYVISAVLALSVMFGIYLMSKVEKAKLGNSISAFAILIGVVVSLIKYDILPIWLVYVCLFMGGVIGLILAVKVKMIQMPQLIALLNGLGGLSSVIVGGYAFVGIGSDQLIFSEAAAITAIIVGGLTFTGSLIAALKLHRLIDQKPIVFTNHKLFLMTIITFILFFVVFHFLIGMNIAITLIVFVLLSFLFGFLFAIRIGGADMPIAISLLNSLSGVAAAISGLAIGDVLLVSVGGIVGASGLLLTQIMCRAMNRSLFEILAGRTPSKVKDSQKIVEEVLDLEVKEVEKDFKDVVRDARSIIVVPGYGMAVAQAQHILKTIVEALKKGDRVVRFAIHPVAGRMPGHMNVLLAEADVDYDELFEMDDLNDDFVNTDLTIVVGANDVLNPSAREAEDTPIYGMPILNVDQSKHIFIFNYDMKPGYAGVENPLYTKKNGVHLFLGNALETLDKFYKEILTIKS